MNDKSEVFNRCIQWECDETNVLIHCRWENRLRRPLLLKGVCVTSYKVTSLLGIYPKEIIPKKKKDRSLLQYHNTKNMKITCPNLGKWYINPMKDRVLEKMTSRKNWRTLGRKVYVAIQAVAKPDPGRGMGTELCPFPSPTVGHSVSCEQFSSRDDSGRQERWGGGSGLGRWACWIVGRGLFMFHSSGFWFGYLWPFFFQVGLQKIIAYSKVDIFVIVWLNWLMWTTRLGNSSCKVKFWTLRIWLFVTVVMFVLSL